MKKICLLLSCLFVELMLLSGPVAAQPVTVGQLTVYGDNTLSFDIAWGPDGGRVTPWSDSVWVLIDYKDPASGGLRRLPVTSATLTAVSSTWSLAKVRTVPGNTTGFFVDGQARALGTAATLTVRVTPQAGVTISKPCVYALDYPPLATYGVDGGDNTVALVGTAPFCGSLINDSGTTMTFPSSAASWTLPAGYRVNEYTDLTGNSGLVDCGASRPTVTGSSGALRCGSGVVTLSATASAGATIDWYSAATGGTLLLSGNMAYNPSVATSTTYYAQARNTGTACTSALRTAVAATVNALPTVSVSVSQTLCFNDSPTALTATPSGGHGSPQVYAWERSTDGSSWNSVSGSTNTYAPGASTLTAYYRAQVTQATTGCTSAYSTPATITVQPQFTPGAIATTGQTLCAGGTPTIISNATAASGGNGVITYSWYKNGTVIAGATATTYTPPPTDATTAATVVYTRKAKDGLCNTTDTLSSGSWTLTVVAEPTISLVPIARALCFNEVAATLTATPAGGHGTPQVYAWQRSTDGSSWSSVFGSTNTYAPGASTLTAYYRAMVTQTTTGCTSDYSAPATITVRPQFTPGAIATTGQSLCAGGTPTIISNATAASGGNGVFTYSWYKNGTVIAGATATTYTPPPTDATTAATVVYTRKAKDGLCNTTDTLSSGSWTMTVVADPSITIAASAQTICYNTSPTALTATPAGGHGTPQVYAWQRSTDGSSWSSVSGSTNTYAPGASTLTAYYRAMVTQTTTGCVSAYSTSATITVRPQFTPGAIATTGQSLCAGGTPTIISNATAASGGNGVFTYSWYKNGTVIAGATATTYTPPPTDATTAATVVYTRKAKDGLCNTTATLSTGSWTMTVVADPTISIAASSQTVCFNDSPAALTATPAGGNGTVSAYAWQRSTNGSSWSNVSGTTNTYSPGASTLTAYYRAQVTQTTTGCTSAYSTPATITAKYCDGPTDSNCSYKTLTIGTTTWAGCNSTYTTVSGTGGQWVFAAKPDTYTPFVQWNKPSKAWSAIALGAQAAWTSATSTASSWSNGFPCPEGWRLPTLAEFQALNDAGSVWGAVAAKGNALAGRFYGSGASSCSLPTPSDCIFLPALGERSKSDGSLSDQGGYGYYWSSEQYNSTSGYSMNFHSNNSSAEYSYDKAYGFSARCVK